MIFFHVFTGISALELLVFFLTYIFSFLYFIQKFYQPISFLFLQKLRSSSLFIYNHIWPYLSYVGVFWSESVTVFLLWPFNIHYFFDKKQKFNVNVFFSSLRYGLIIVPSYINIISSSDYESTDKGFFQILPQLQFSVFTRAPHTVGCGTRSV